MNCKRTVYGRKCVCDKKAGDCRDRRACTPDSPETFPFDRCDYTTLAMVYGISQRWQNICDGETGFERGTIFGDLYMPFMGDKCRNGGDCK